MAIDPMMALRVQLPRPLPTRTERQASQIEQRKQQMSLQDLDRQEQIRQALVESGGDPEKALPAIMQIDPELGFQLQTKFQQQKAQQATAQRTAQEQQNKAKWEAHTRLSQILGPVKDQNTLTAAKQQIASMFGPEAATNVPDEYGDGSQIEFLKQQGLSYEKQLELEGKGKPAKPAAGSFGAFQEIPEADRPGFLKNLQDFSAAGRAPEKAPAPPNVGSFEDYMVRKYGPNPTADQVEAGRKAYQQADDRPRIDVSVGSTDDADAIADAIISGDQPPTMTGLYRLAGPVKAAIARKGYNLATATLDWTATQKHVSTLNGAQQTRMGQAIDNAAHSLDVIEDLAGQWDGGKFPLLNKGRLMAAKSGALGPKAQQIATQLEAQISDVTSELGNVYMGGNSPTDHALTLAAKNLSADWTRDQLKSALALARKNLQIRQNSMRNVGVSGASPGNQYATPTAPAVAAPTGRYNPATGKIEPQ